MPSLLFLRTIFIFFRRPWVFEWVMFLPADDEWMIDDLSHHHHPASFCSGVPVLLDLS